MALSRSYSHNLPSSFSTAHPSALEYSSRPPVSVCGTGCYSLALEVFLGGMISVTPLSRSLAVLSSSALRADFPTQRLPTPLNELFRQFVDVSLPRHPIETIASTGILTSFPSATPFGFA
jgi:hypothetical protein